MIKLLILMQRAVGNLLGPYLRKIVKIYKIKKHKIRSRKVKKMCSFNITIRYKNYLQKLLLSIL